MKKFRTLIIQSDESQLVVLLERLKNAGISAFTYQKKMTENYAKNIFADEDHVAYFKTERKTLFESGVFVLVQDGVLTVTNIVSPSNPRLRVEEYNSVLMAFYEELIVPQLNDTYHVQLSNEEIAMQDILDADTLEKLELWEYMCNKERPVDHPEDYRRWINFVVSAYRHKIKLPHEDFTQWLKEDRNWPDAFEGEIEKSFYLYEYGLDILKSAHDENW